MMSSRKMLAAALVAAQILLPVSGSAQNMAAAIAGRGIQVKGQALIVPVAGMAHVQMLGIGAPAINTGLGATLLLNGALVPTALSATARPAAAKPGIAISLIPGNVIAEAGIQPKTVLSQVLGAADAEVGVQMSDEDLGHRGRQRFDLMGDHGAETVPAFAAASYSRGAASGFLSAASSNDQYKGGSDVPAPKAESKFKVSTLVDAVIAGFVYGGYKWVALPVATTLGAVAFTLGVDIPLNLPHYIVALPGYALEWSSLAIGYLAPVVQSVSTGLSNFAHSTGVLPEVYGTLAQIGGYASGIVSSGMAAVVQPFATAGQYIVDTAAPLMVVNTKAIMNAIPTEWWWFGPAVVANYRSAKANGWKLVGGPAQKWVESKTNIPGVSFLGWATDALLVNPMLFIRDIGRDVIKPVIQPIWDVIKDVAQWVYDYPLTYLGYTLRSVGVGTVSTVTAAIISPFILTAAFLMNYAVTPTYRALRAMTRTKTGVAILLGGVALVAVGGFFGLYSLANLAAFLADAVPLIATGIKGAWWLGATVTGAIGFGVGAYYGFKNKFLDAAKLTYDKVIGTTVSWLEKAMETFRQAHRDASKS